MSTTLVRLAGHDGLPLLVVGPSLGTSAEALWTAAAEHLADSFHVVGWDLPGHGRNRWVPQQDVSMADLAADVLAAVDALAGPKATFDVAGDSVGGAVSLQLLLDAPARVRSAVLLCTGAAIGTPASWAERTAAVRASGTPSLVATSAQRWFGPGFVEREPARSSALLHALSQADDAGYAAVCGALARFDVRDRLGEAAAPVLAVAGAHDVATPPASLREVADGVPRGRLVVLEDVAHLAPAEAPEEVARLVEEHVLAARSAATGSAAAGSATGASSSSAPAVRDAMTVAQVRDAGMVVRREVLGDAHVDRATAAATDLTREFQQFITEFAWGSVWTRPGLDRRSRSVAVLTALIARGHHEEFAMHVRAARRNGLSVDEIKEVILQAAIYCGVPDANTAFRIAQEVLTESTAHGHDAH
ncbi:4-carboxymuconolactone decarboxylase /3-oxoadipate enol-lactonase [Quadrisphaera granulorum]|uniref:4-carboxymuconolactone decarboxylase /3-oxoadipate enol-lactonase n=1 Tax=Quadrisphaera granulorum TaxID=317664 RepID=A0A316AAI2_9ACTN|nr:4-carboxymuconolactone decarboxylase [Quadrisphaera granulorum]PWJ54409.1 4-carboxymuconolactone decarboxylase /3-oxoadipate enol-lactonase [Quadrisphaera granulorum]SZE96181.1 4-carboxymuconolactone decarboxylase /3-oxoadipate enol-lactonase [Quadrisphaera granulorum]